MISFLASYKGKKVLNKDKKELGEISGVVFDIDYEKIIGFTYRKSFLKYDFFLVLNILENSLDYLIIESDINKDDKDYYELIGKQVRNTKNQIIGNIDNIEFDLTYKLKNFIIDVGYNISSIEIITQPKISIKKNFIKVSKKAILSYEKDYVLIDDNNFIKENKKILENMAKIFINIPNPSYNLTYKKYD